MGGERSGEGEDGVAREPAGLEAALEDGGRGHKECRGSLEAGKGKKTDSLLGSPEET